VPAQRKSSAIPPVALLFAGLAGLALFSKRRTIGKAAADVASVIGVEVQRDLSLLQPEFQVKVQAVLADVASKGEKPYVFETVRSLARQAAVLAAGNSSVERGKHQEGLAVDIVSAEIVHGYPVWWGDSEESWGLSEQQKQDREDAAARFFAVLGAAAEAQGLTWGGRWTDPYDPAHIQG